jgi:hypothetical protein
MDREREPRPAPAPMNRELLQDVYQFLLRLQEQPLPGVAFDMGAVIRRFDDPLAELPVKPVDCHTAACVMGCIALDPTMSAKTGIGPADVPGHLTYAGDRRPWSFVARLVFGLNTEQVDKLFCFYVDRTNTLEEVTERFRLFLAEHKGT